MLNGIHLVDFGNHQDTRLTFGRMTALVGQNGAGKTGVLRAVQGISMAAACHPEKWSLSSVGSVRKGCEQTVLSASWPFSRLNERGDLGAQLSASDGPLGWKWQWWSRTSHPEADVWLFGDSAPAGAAPINVDGHEFFQKAPMPNWIAGRVWNLTEVPTRANFGVPVARYFKAVGAHLQGPSYTDEITPVLGDDGSDLPSVLTNLRNNEPERFDAVLDALREVVPSVKGIRARRAPVERVEKKTISINSQQHAYDEVQRVIGQELLFDMASGKGLPANEVSEGTLLALALLTLLHSDNAPGLLLLDDIESALHPRAQRDLIRQLRKLQETRPELQIIFSSHSPYVIDEMAPGDVWIFAADDGGIAHSARLSDHPDAERAMGPLTTGEFWGAEGDAWVLEPVKAAQPEAQPATVG